MRTTATVIAAWLLLLCLILGVPLALAALFGWPLSGVRVPHGMPRDPWTLHTLSRWVAIAVWLLWAQFTAAVATEIRSVRSSRSISAAHEEGRDRGTGTGTGPAAGSRPSDPRSARGRQPQQRGRRSAEQRAHAQPRWNLSRALARSLVAVTFAGALSSAAVTVASAQTVPAAAPVAVVAVLPAGGATGPGAPVTPDAVTSSTVTDSSQQQSSTSAAPQYQYYEVQQGDSLWLIADRYLGDGNSYTEIVALNLGRMQPDGGELEEAGLIQPGWVLTLPGSAQGAGLLVQPPAAATTSTAPTPAAPATTTPPAANAPASAAPSASASANGHNGHTTATSAATQIAQRPTTAANGTHRATDTSAHSAKSGSASAGSSNALPHPVASRPALGDDGSSKRPVAENTVLHTIADALPYVALIGSPVLAAALLGALTSAARRRRRDRPGAPLVSAAAPPDPAVAEVERTIRAAAATDTVDLIDRAMRGLWPQTSSGASAAVPPVRFARADSECLHLLFERPAGAPPAPWTAQAGGKQWRVDRAAAEIGDLAHADPAAVALAVPYPLLLCIGSAGEEQVMINLAAAPGRSTVLTGPPRQRRAVLAAAAATLAASPWSAQVRIEAVGLPPELALLAPDRLRIHPDLAGAVSALRSGAAADAGAQILSADPAEPSPIRLLIVEGIQPYDLTQLPERLGLSAGATPDHLGAAVLAGCDTPPPDSAPITVDSIGRLRVPGIAGDLSGARLPDTLASALGALFRSADRPRIANRPADLPEPGSAGAEAASGAKAGAGAGGSESLDRPAGIRVCLLGPVELYGTNPVDPSRGPLFTEALVLLLFYRAGLPAAVFSRALWPRGITYAARDRMLRDLRAWLGSGPSGPRLVLGPDSLVRLSWDVRSDWEEFQGAYRTAGQFADDLSAPRPDGATDGTELADLAQSELTRALRLVRGELLADRPQSRYSWLGFGTQETEVPAVIADAAYRLAEVRLRSGDAPGAQWAAEQGLLGAPDDERLVQVKLRAIAARGDRDLLHDAVADLRVRAWRRYGETDLRPETGAVVDQMMAMIAG